MNLLKVSTFLVVLLLGFATLMHGQNTTQVRLQHLDQLLTKDDNEQAKIFTLKQIDSLEKLGAYYEITDYIYYLGQTELRLHGEDLAIKTLSDFEMRFESLTQNQKALRQLALETGAFYESLGNSEKAKTYNLKALEITKRMPDAKGQDFALIESNLGVYCSRLGDIITATKYHKKALQSLKSDVNAEADSYYISYNSLGAMMWYASKFDSAVYYYKKAEKTLAALEQTAHNKFYRPASLNNNISVIYSIQGNVDAAINAMRTTVNHLNAFLKEDISDARRTRTRVFLFQAIDNYAGLYKDIGDFSKAKQLLTYAFDQKEKYLDNKSPEIAKSKILLGQIEYDLHNYKVAENYLDQGITLFKSDAGNHTYWLASGYHSKALIQHILGDTTAAQASFARSADYYEVSLGDYFDESYLDFVLNASNFYAQIGESNKALSMAEDALKYIKTNQGEKTLLEYYQQLNLADIHYKIGDYKTALQRTDVALEMLDSKEFIKINKLNTVQLESNKISATFLKVKAQLKLHPSRDEGFLINQLLEIKKAIRLLDEKKVIAASDNSTALLIQDNIEVFGLAKALNLELYELTKNDSYLESLLSYHESMIYHKIRTRLNSKSTKLSAKLPEAIREKEKDLKDKLNTFLDENEDFYSYFEYEKQWNAFLEMLEKDYPSYYKLRYASISQSLDNITSKVPEDVTLVRYLYIDDALYAFIINHQNIKMYALNSQDLGSKITELNTKNAQIQPSFQLQNDLYKILWQPFQKDIITAHVIIIPDKTLFNLSFDLLTTEVCKDYMDLNKKSLLARYNISYNYSLFLIDGDSQPIGFDANFIAFAPEFNDTMKTNYKVAILDSVKMDQTYMKLLPQPFAKELAKTYSKLFNGASFLNEKASKSIFTSNAKEHKIIHIGTHAESNNVSPEFSRLIFAKQSDEDNNSLYTYEIYNQNLASNLAILTACETGKPSYQPGEGMISLAHAFNYAGSESILTSLWKIDEKSSSEILDYFYKNISKGLRKDEALREAKLSYIAKATGRTVAPQYWAGLVLIGNTAPIAISTTSIWWIWVLLALIAALGIGFFMKNKSATRGKIEG